MRALAQRFGDRQQGQQHRRGSLGGIGRRCRGRDSTRAEHDVLDIKQRLVEEIRPARIAHDDANAGTTSCLRMPRG